MRLLIMESARAVPSCDIKAVESVWVQKSCITVGRKGKARVGVVHISPKCHLLIDQSIKGEISRAWLNGTAMIMGDSDLDID